MAGCLRNEVLHCFKSLHQARKTVFKGDKRALIEGRKKINEEFRKQMHEQNTEKIQELINYSKAVEIELRTCVIQAREVAPGRYQAEISSDTLKLDNVPFREDACCSNVKVEKKNKACS